MNGSYVLNSNYYSNISFWSHQDRSSSLAANIEVYILINQSCFFIACVLDGRRLRVVLHLLLCQLRFTFHPNRRRTAQRFRVVGEGFASRFIFVDRSFRATPFPRDLALAFCSTWRTAPFSRRFIDGVLRCEWSGRQTLA